jgi:predicted nucleic acid-binding Zn ribbon protein
VIGDPDALDCLSAPNLSRISLPSDRKSPRQPQPVGDLVSGFLRRSGLAEKVEAASVIPRWSEIVGPQIARVTRAARVSEGTLFVAVRSSAWMSELNLMKSDLLRRINAGRQSGRIEQIVFVMDG